MLSSHEQIFTNHELLNKFIHNNCDILSTLSSNNICDWKHYSKELTDIITTKQFYKNKKNITSDSIPNLNLSKVCQFIKDKDLRFVSKSIRSRYNYLSNANHVESQLQFQLQIRLFKIQLEQIYPEWMDKFVRYIYCHNLIVLHIIRLNTINIFWSHEAEAIEHSQILLSDRNVDATSHARVSEKDRIESFLVDIDEATWFVKTLEKNLKMLVNMIEYFPFDIKYYSFYYENIIGKYGNDYWSSIESFLGVKKRVLHVGTKINIYGNRTSLDREHKLPCYRKIENWKQLKPKLKNSPSYYLCERELS